MTEKRLKFDPLFPTLIMGAGGRPMYFKMAKNVKILIIFARDCLRWGCLGVSCPKFEILPKSRDQDDIFQSINRKIFVPQNVEILQGGCARGEPGKNKEAFLTNLIFYYHLLTRKKSLGK
jgi:hypothetical protein